VRERGRRCNSEEVVRGKAELQKSIRRSKRELWSDLLKNFRRAKVWRGARYVNPRAVMTMEASTDREGKEGNTSLEKEEMLRHKAFPLNNCDQYYKLHPAGSAHTRITEQAVERALFSQAIKTDLGPDKLSFGAIRLLWRWDMGSIMRLIREASHMGGYPAVWKRASGLVLRKPGKDDYTKLKAYRSISLLSCMGIVLGKITAEPVSEKAERRGLLSDRQCTSRKG